MTSVDSNFNFLCGRPHGAGPPLLPSTCVHLSLTLSPPCGRHKWTAPYMFYKRLLRMAILQLFGTVTSRYIGEKIMKFWKVTNDSYTILYCFIRPT